jgi:hypothetical protein
MGRGEHLGAELDGWTSDLGGCDGIMIDGYNKWQRQPAKMPKSSSQRAPISTPYLGGREWPAGDGSKRLFWNFLCLVINLRSVTHRMQAWKAFGSRKLLR